jgi:hypothetical protein
MSTLHQIIEAKLVAGRLSAHPGGEAWYGKGTWQPCHACDRSVTPGEVEVETVFDDGQRLRLHAACFHLWASMAEAGSR